MLEINTCIHGLIQINTKYRADKLIKIIRTVFVQRFVRKKNKKLCNNYCVDDPSTWPGTPAQVSREKNGLLYSAIVMCTSSFETIVHQNTFIFVRLPYTNHETSRSFDSMSLCRLYLTQGDPTWMFESLLELSTHCAAKAEHSC